MKKYLLYIVLTISCLLIYTSVAIFISSHNNINIHYSNSRIETYKIYLAGEVNYEGEIELQSGTKLGDFIYSYLTKYSDLNSFNDSTIIENYKTYTIAYKSKININTCEKKELETLDGVGKVYSQSIISQRPYQNISELKDNKVIGAALYDSIKNEICC